MIFSSLKHYSWNARSGSILSFAAVFWDVTQRSPKETLRAAQGALTSVLESRVLCFLAAILNFFNTRAQSASARSGTEILEVWDSQILGGSDRSPEIIKWQGMKLLTFFVACLCQLGGTEVRCEEQTGSQNVGFVTCCHSCNMADQIMASSNLQMFWKLIQLWNVKESTVSQQTNLKYRNGE